MPNFIITKILEAKSIVIPSTLVYGDTELRSSKSDSEFDILAFKESAKINNLNYENYQFCARISTVIIGDNLENAKVRAENEFTKILDLKSIEYSISEIKTSTIGFVKDLDTGKIDPIGRDQFSSSLAFTIQHSSIQLFDLTNYILKNTSEFNDRYLRSLHWARSAKHETNNQLKVLFYWFSMEALLKESENDNIAGTLRWFLGFPNGHSVLFLKPITISSLSAHSSYDYWKKRLIDILENIRVFRNESVHSGFRSVDFEKPTLDLYNDIMSYATSRAQSSARFAIINNITTLHEFKEYIYIIFENNVNVVNDVHHNMLFSFDQHRKIAN